MTTGLLQSRVETIILNRISELGLAYGDEEWAIASISRTQRLVDGGKSAE